MNKNIFAAIRAPYPGRSTCPVSICHGRMGNDDVTLQLTDPIAGKAAEKILKAALYLEDRNKAETFQRGGTSHSLTIISLSLQSNDSNRLASALESRVGHHTNMRYPSFQGCPCDYYTTDDANYMLSTTEELMQLLRPHFVS
nr:uncharacterized protein LOC123766597 isoform X2 [Procambarus clarkii]